MKLQISLFVLCLSLALGWDSKLLVSVFYSPQSHGDPKPSNAFEAIVKAFDTRKLVALGETHWLQEEADFIALLIRHPEFSIKVNDNAGGLIERGRPKSLFIIIPHSGFLEQTEQLDPRLESWPKPSLAILKGTWLGALDASLAMFDVASRDGGKCFYNPNAGTSLEDMADAYLYLGPGNSLTRSLPSPDLYKDEAYVNELKRRHKLKGRDFDPASTIAYIMEESSKKFENKPPFKLQKKCP